MEQAVTGMEALWTAVSTVMTNMMTALGTVTTGLLANEIFQLIIGLVVFGLVVGLIFLFVRKAKRRGN